MSAYESRLRAWAKGAGMARWSTASFDDLLACLQETGLLRRFYDAFPIYNPRSDAYVLNEVA